MTTNLIDPNSIPDYLRQAYDDSSVGNLLRGGPTVDRISIRGRVWRLIEGGQEIAANPNPQLNVVLIAAAPHVSRSFYEGEYDPEKKEPPQCWSSDGNVPDAAVPAAQKRSNNCAQCPLNVPGSGKRDSRACRFQQRIAVALPDTLSKVYAMTIPATSLWGDKVQAGQPAPLTQYAQFLASNRLPMEGVVTEMSFDVNETQPTMRFKVAGWLQPQQLVQAKELGQSEEASAAIQYNVIARELSLPEPARPIVQPMPVQTAPQPQVIQPTQTIQPQASFVVTPQATPEANFAQPNGHFVTGLTATPAATFTPTPTATPAAEEPKRRTRAAKAATATPPAGFGAPQGFTAPAAATPAAPAGFSQTIVEPNVISPAQAAAQTGTTTDDIQSLLAKWNTGG